MHNGGSMRAVVQRCTSASVTVDDKIVGQIGKGFVCFVGVKKEDNAKDLDYLVRKVCGLRVFCDENDKMNLAPKDVGAELLVISNFTLYANTSHGFRPDFFESMPPQEAKILIDQFISKCQNEGAFRKINSGIFGADMHVDVQNDGPITIIIDSADQKK